MDIKNSKDNSMRPRRRGYYSDIITGEFSIVIIFAIKWRSQ